jgi:hypothetical protein
MRLVRCAQATAALRVLRQSQWITAQVSRYNVHSFAALASAEPSAAFRNWIAVSAMCAFLNMCACGPVPAHLGTARYAAAAVKLDMACCVPAGT